MTATDDPGKKLAGSRRPGRPPAPSEPIRERLLAAAAILFNADGYLGTDSNKIARAAGVSPATFYRHFADKKAIFLEAYARWVSGDWDVIERALARGGDPRAIARSMSRAHLRRHRQWVRFRLSMHALVASDPQTRAFHLKARDAQLDRMAQALAGFGAPAHSRADLLYSFLCVERASNAVTDGDLDALGIRSSEFVARIEDEIVYQLTGSRTDRR